MQDDLFLTENKIKWRISNRLVSYEESSAFMEEYVAKIHYENAPEMVWLLEHPPLYTAGTSAKNEDLLDVSRFPVYQTGRGGEHTYHGPGQRVAYVMLDLKKRGSQDIKLYVKNLEKWIINSLKHFDIKGEVREGRVGIWVEESEFKDNKIAAIGIRVRKWVTFHGIAINIEPDLSHFGGIVPCGILSHGITSAKQLGKLVCMADLDVALRAEFSKLW